MAETAEILGLSYQTVYRLLQRGLLRSSSALRCKIIAKTEIERFLRETSRRHTKTLPALQHDPNRPEDVMKVDADEEGNGGDDAADCLRYLVATRPRTIEVRKLRGL
jgi:hypothetical protein